MRRLKSAFAALMLACLGGASWHACATEGAGGLYLLGSQTLGAGRSPAPGWYLSDVMVRYDGAVGGASVGGVTLVSLKKRAYSTAVNVLYAPRPTLWGGQAAVSITVPYASLRLSGEITGTRQASRAISNSGMGDTAITGRLGWKPNNAFAHALSLTAWIPTGNYRKGFNASIGRNRWAYDALWAMTYLSPRSHIEFSTALGYGINRTNSITRYRSGNEAHLEVAMGKRISAHWTVGVAGYAYRQTTADTGRGAFLGDLKGRVLGLGPTANFATRVNSHPVVMGLRYYREFDADHHFRGDVAIASATVRL